MTAAGRRRSGRWIRGWFFGVAGGIAAAVFLAWLLFSPMPEIPVPFPEARDFAVQNRVLGRVVSELWNGRTDDSVIVFSPEETASLLRVAANGVLISGTMRFVGGRGEFVNPYRIEYRDGGFDFTVPVCDTGRRWLFGGALVLRGRAVPAKAEEILTPGLSGVRLGRVPVPGFAADAIVRRFLARQRERREFRIFDAAVREFQIDAENHVVLVYRPAELRRALAGK